jgi:hypothetical protein
MVMSNIVLQEIFVLVLIIITKKKKSKQNKTNKNKYCWKWLKLHIVKGVRDDHFCIGLHHLPVYYFIKRFVCATPPTF